MLHLVNQASQIGNYLSLAINQPGAGASAPTGEHTENKLSAQFIKIGNSNIELKAVEEKENNLFNGIRNNKYLKTITNIPELTTQNERFCLAGLV
ncbi:MAG TPA: hypothetical protein ACHBX0_00325 [Arsenophonus sp.]